MGDTEGVRDHSRPGRPPERLRLSEPAMSEAKAALDDAEQRLGMSGRRLAELLHISPRTWRSYKDPAEPGPTPDVVQRLDALLAESDKGTRGELSRLWGMPPLSEAADGELTAAGAKVAPTRRVAVLAVLVAVAVGVGVVSSRDSDSGANETEVVVYNKVVLDETRMREDTPGYLTTSPDCLAKSQCGVEGTDFLRTGTRLKAVCQTEGMEVTNRFGDTPNPENFDSTRWYGVTVDGTFGYFPEVWVAKEYRGGLGLRRCEPSG
jgi:hypothetical protein